VEPTREQEYQRRIAELEAEVAELKAQVVGKVRAALAGPYQALLVYAH
jgi:hypothetical protein